MSITVIILGLTGEVNAQKAKAPDHHSGAVRKNQLLLSSLPSISIVALRMSGVKPYLGE